ncbi:MAG: rod shape-determining protein MreC [Planctomycetota bacterium]|jgi:cell shape-determining protein MreC
MRFRKIDRYLLLLAGLFVLAILVRGDLPGEEVLPDVYRATIHAPLLAQASEALAEPELEVVRLKSELAAAKFQIRQLKEQMSARRELGQFLRAIEWQSPPVAIPGWVFAVGSDAYRRTFRIDCGSSAGVGRSMPVVTGKALLGVVKTVTLHGATVLRVDDPEFRIEVELPMGEDRYVRGVAHGTGDRGFEVRFVRAPRSLQPGTPVFTSSYNEEIPPGLLVGEIEEVEDQEQDGVLEVQGTPAASLGRFAQIEVLKLRKRWPTSD